LMTICNGLPHCTVIGTLGETRDDLEHAENYAASA